MQKFRVMNDLHLEFGRFEVPELDGDNETILILAGDVQVGHAATEFLKPVLRRFQDVVYVLGNHEFYHHDMVEVRKWWQMAQRYQSNLHVLDNGVFDFYDRKGNAYRILGTTLWTATNDPAVEDFLNDYACIRIGEDVLTAQNTRDLYLEAVDFLQREIPNDGTTTIVVTHHAPVEACVQKQWIGHEMNKCFHNHLDWLIAENDIELWIHGHMHDTVHFTQDGTEIYCNPRGYKGFGQNIAFRDDFVIEL